MVAINIDTPNGTVAAVLDVDSLAALWQSWHRLAFKERDPKIALQWHHAYLQAYDLWDAEMKKQFYDLINLARRQ